MSTHPSTAPDPVEKFRDRYLELLSKQGRRKDYGERASSFNNLARKPIKVNPTTSFAASS